MNEFELIQGNVAYWDRIWKVHGDPPIYQWACLIEVKGKFYITSRSGSIKHNEDFGPYDTLNDALAAAVTIHELDAAPKHWPRYETIR